MQIIFIAIFSNETKKRVEHEITFKRKRFLCVTDSFE